LLRLLGVTTKVQNRPKAIVGLAILAAALGIVIPLVRGSAGVTVAHASSSRAAERQLVSTASAYGRRALAIARHRIAVRGHTFFPAGTPPDPLAIAAMRNAALQMALLNGEVRPFGAEAWSTTRQMAVSVASDDRVDTDQSCFVVELSGHFTAYLASTPGGAPPPTGRTMTLTFDAQTLELTDWGVRDTAPAFTQRLGGGMPLGF
jgi:hypothetical protein